MHFAAPIWLALLLPWAVLAAWLMWMRYASGTRVPFLQLWRGPIDPSRATRRLHRPPLALLALIVAMLLAILAAARPVIRLNVSSPRVPATAPATRPNVAITYAAAVERPRPQVMVTVRNDAADRSAAVVELHSGGQSTRRDIALPPPGRDANFFVDLPALADTAEVKLDGENGATLLRKSPPPRVELRGDVPPEVRRVAEAYARARPAAGEQPRMVAIPPGTVREAGIGIASGAWSPANPRDVRVVAHPVTANTDFSSIEGLQATSEPPSGERWTPLVSVGGKTIVAMRESPMRQIWVGFRSSPFARTPAFVVFWTNAIDWVAGTGESMFVATIPPLASSNAAKRQAADAAPGPRELELAPDLAFCGLLCVFFASLNWGSARRLTAFSAPRTVI